MNKQELKSLAMKYFNLTDITDSTENNEEVKEQNFASATLADGTKIMTMTEGDFKVGDELHVVTEEGQHVIAPEGEHTTQSGIVITVSGQGIITGVKYPDQEGEGSLEEASKEEMSSDEEEAAEETADESEEKTELAEEETVMEDDETQMEDIREEIIAAIAEVVMPEMEGLKAKLAEHEEKLAEHEDKMNEHYSKTPASESKTATSRFSKNKLKLTENEGPKYNKKRYEMALARLTNKN